ncbi:MAG TPA: peptide chain release factor N(5)-glutamine methyltransferase [Lactovum miscens]|uniref:peptide chain release factor N(5)-glutamine methyltransferase n=1 Tax=Lactovum miscens TaxID=190387 RepID=UPI002EDB7CC6
MIWIKAVREVSTRIEEPFELEYVWRHLHGLSKLDWINQMRLEISDEEMADLKEISLRLENHEPPQYIVGEETFSGLKFKVDPRVLIPRPETEELINLILNDNRMIGKQKVLDIGTGSGAIAVSLAKNRPDWDFVASDISSEALLVAKENAKVNSVKLSFVQSNVMDGIKGKFDIIVSNPPYISRQNKDEVDISVLGSEPDQALFADHDGLAAYEKIANQAPAQLTENGKIYLEIGYKQGAIVKSLFEAAFPDKKVEVFPDFSGKDRMICVR